MPQNQRATTEQEHAANHTFKLATHARCDLTAMRKHARHDTEELLLGNVTRQVLSECRTDLLMVVDPRPPQG